MTSSIAGRSAIWLAAGVRTPFAKVDGPLAGLDAIALSVPVVREMVGRLRGAAPDFAVWGAVAPNLTWSNIAREILMDAGVPPTVPAFSTVMACATSMIGGNRGRRNDRRRRAQSGARRRRGEHEQDPARPLTAPLRLAAPIPAGAIARAEDRAAFRFAARRYQALHPVDHQSHDRNEHGRAYGDHREGMGHRA